MPRNFREYLSRNQSPGVLLISQTWPVGNAVEELLLIWAASDHGEWANQLTYLPL
jgi:hypothetical protein